MQSKLIRIFTIVFTLLFSVVGSGKVQPKKLIGIFYLKSPFAHVHSAPNRYSQTLTTLSCGHPVKVYADTKLTAEWHNIKVANYSGFLRRVQLSSEKVKCWQDRYSRFFSGMKLEISDIYYWGKLYDQFLTGRVGIE